MKQRYSIKGTIRMGEFVRLLLTKEDIAKESKKMGIMEMASNLNQVMETQQTKAVLTQQPDMVTISYDEWKEHMYKVDDIVWIDVNPEA